jgi:60S ribosome subunit biogenesis protein NIP7
MTDNIPKYAGVVYYSMNDLSLGFGIASRSSLETKDLEPTAIIGFN